MARSHHPQRCRRLDSTGLHAGLHRAVAHGRARVTGDEHPPPRLPRGRRVRRPPDVHGPRLRLLRAGRIRGPLTLGRGHPTGAPRRAHHPELVDAINRVRAERGEPGPAIDWGKAALPDEVIDWADVIIVHHFPDRWIGGQWDRIKHKRVIWRTCGQSDPELEDFMGQFDGLQIVRYSPNEQTPSSRSATSRARTRSSASASTPTTTAHTSVTGRSSAT